MIDSCGLHIGCLLTCTSGVNVYTVELLATVTGTHTIEYHFLSRVIRFDIEATIGQQFEIPTTYFNESGDARIKIILPSGAYFTYTDGTTVYDTFYLTVRSSQDSNFIPAVLPPGVPFATQGYVNAAIAALGIPFTHSLVEQVWPYEKWIGGATIYVWTFDLGDGDLVFGFETIQLTGLLSASIGFIVRSDYMGETAATNKQGQTIVITVSGATASVLVDRQQINRFVTVYYTKP